MVFETFLVWEMLMLSSDAPAATNLLSLRAPDGDTSDEQDLKTMYVCHKCVGSET